MTVPSADGVRLVLRGHAPAEAELAAERFSVWARLLRTAGACLAWLGSTALTLVLTFDPFVASFPFVLGGAFTYRSWRGRYRVLRFRGACPRCGGDLELPPGSRIRFPHPLVCYGCHHEPELVPAQEGGEIAGSARSSVSTASAIVRTAST